jgi:hypothetical protein
MGTLLYLGTLVSKDFRRDLQGWRLDELLSLIFIRE